MYKRLFLPLLVLVAFVALGNGWAQDSSAPAQSGANTAHKKAAASKKHAKASSKSAAGKKRVTSARLRRMSKAFVASTELKPMARQLIENRTPAAYDGVESYARRHAGTDAGAMALLAVGYAHILDREYAKAIPPLRKAQLRAGELADYVRYFEALAYGGTLQSNEVVATLKDFSKEAPDSIFARDVVPIYGDALVAAGRSQEAIDYLEANRKPMHADVELALAHADLNGGNTDKGMEVLRHLYFTMPLSAEATQAGAELLARGSDLSGSYADRKTRAELLAKGNHLPDAIREYRSLLETAPAEERGAIQVALGSALRRSGEETEGRSWLLQAQTNGEANAQRLCGLVEIARSENNDGELLNYLNQLRQAASQSPWFESALVATGNMYLLRKDYDHAIDLYREAQERFPNGNRASFAHWKAAWLNFRQGRTDEAVKEFAEHVREYPASSETVAALYWHARVSEERNDLPAARAWYAKVADRYRNYYYGHLAGERLVQIGNAPQTQDPLLNLIPPAAPIGIGAVQVDPPGDQLRAEKSKLLENAGMTDFAVKELRAADGGSGANWATLEIARIYGESGQYHRALRFVKSAVPGYYALDVSALPRRYWDYLFPRPYWTEVRRFAMQNGLDPYLVAALIRQESEFNPGAVSHANAWGLMQLLPITGKNAARELRIPHFRTETLLVPNINLQLGTRYFHEMVEHYSGQVEYALAAYNAGSNRVEDWLGVGHYRDVPEFVESIPFTETREYVQSIMRNAHIYRQLYPE